MKNKFPNKYLLIIFLFLIRCGSPEVQTIKNNTVKNYSAKEIYNMTVNNTVTIITGTALGSGFFIDSNKIITNYHVIKGADKANIIINNSDKRYTITGYLAVDKINDLILLQVDYHNNDFIKMMDSIPQPGDKIFAIGSPVGLAKTISEGMISGIRNFEERKLLQITAPISHGSSGCPIINEQGKAVGVAVGAIAEANDVNFCIPITFAKALIDFKENYPKELSSLYGATNQNQNAKKEDSHSISNTTANSFCHLGEDYISKGDWDTAIYYLKKSIAINPKNEYAYDGLGTAYYKKGDNETAIYYYMKSIAIHPGDFAYARLGIAYYDKGDNETAIFYLKKAIDINDTYIIAYNYLGLAYNKKGDNETGNYYLEKAYKLDPSLRK